MAGPKIPSEIARETLRLLAARRLSPSPDNYKSLYDEIAGAASPAPFPDVSLRAILRVLPTRTPAQKRLHHLLGQAVAQQSWLAVQSVMVDYANLDVQGSAAAIADPLVDDEPVEQVPTRLAETVARLVDHSVLVLGEDDGRLQDMALQLSSVLRGPQPGVSIVERMLADFSHRLSFAVLDHGAVRGRLLELLHLVLDNISALSIDDEWLHGQVEALLGASTPPLNLRRLEELERRLKDVIFKQTNAKDRLVQAQEQMRELLAAFIERLAQMDESSSSYHSQMEQYAERISRATQLQEITPVLQEVIDATRAMALTSRITRSELLDLRTRGEASHAEIDQLRQELDHASALARQDPLTGSLNRKGLDEALEREILRAQHQESPLCIALLDLDNFKAINDRLGHTAGDEALVHLAEVARQVLRPKDQLARYGGEEFVILLPDTGLDDGVQVMRRLQRELTTRYFLKGSERVLITFSAGVAQLKNPQDGAEAIRRADQGMYLAKRSGKNRVVAA
ncbi:GGDEF domain-containing protein [Melaminivora sp.]|uniref:GGDEF domain-containing protein n=1 Tax=Melaminivora sp. TaxID=1933032 RepID=UPI0028AC4815|nr:GGDEF domain-containing protein [Melaminivora sp.]